MAAPRYRGPRSVDTNRISVLDDLPTGAEIRTALVAEDDSNLLTDAEYAAFNALTVAIDEQGSAVTLTSSHLGRAVLVNNNVTFPVLTSAAVFDRIDLLCTGAGNLVAASGVTFHASSITAFEAGSGVSATLMSSNGSAAVWFAIGGIAA